MVVALGLIDRLTAQIVELEEELCADGAAHAYAPLLMTIPGIGWILAHTVAAEDTVRVMATSREGLRAGSEHLWPVPPLPVDGDKPRSG